MESRGSVAGQMKVQALLRPGASCELDVFHLLKQVAETRIG